MGIWGSSSQRNISPMNPLAGDPVLNLEIQSLKRRTVYESHKFKTSRVLRGGMGCSVQQRRQSDDEAAIFIFGGATRGYESASAFHDRRAMDQLGCRSVASIAAQSLAIAGSSLPRLGISSAVGTKECGSSVKYFRPARAHSSPAFLCRRCICGPPRFCRGVDGPLSRVDAGYQLDRLE